MARLDENETRTTELLNQIAALRNEATTQRDLASHNQQMLAGLTQSVGEHAGHVADALGRLGHDTASTSATAMLAIGLAELNEPALRSDGPLVTIIVPTWNRAADLTRALRSIQAQTYDHWECLVIDDGSTDDTTGTLAPFIVDPRIRVTRTEHHGAAAARNEGLGRATGDLVAYLDSDNTWHRSHLARVVDALHREPTARWAFTQQVVVDEIAGTADLRYTFRSLDSLVESNFIDMNTVVHRRDVIDEIGPFDAQLTRLSDWDLVIRLAAIGDPAPVSVATSIYRTRSTRRISDQAPLHINRHRIQSRYRGQRGAGLRVLFAEWHYPQVTETYIASVVSGLSHHGVDVAAWSEVDVAVHSGTEIPVYRGSLEEAIDDHRPDIVLTHWLHMGEKYRPVTRAAGIPHVVRNHGFEYDPATVGRLLEDPGVLVHTFPHLVDPAWVDHPRVVVTPTCFDDDRFAPTIDKDPYLVLRTAAGLNTKDLDTFLLAAERCPDHHFVLVLGQVLTAEARALEWADRVAATGAPVDIRINVPHDEIDRLVARAGIYLHTHGTQHPVSMPISIAEAMATGAWVLGRDLPGVGAYLGPTGTLYDGETNADRADQAARLIRASAAWSSETWAHKWQAASDSAYGRFASQDVTAAMLDAWITAFNLVDRRA